MGQGGSKRSVSAAIFADAKRFHFGGLPGLRVDEVPAILQRGEEVLRRDDPRHVLNGGNGAPVVKFKNINLFDPAEAVSQGLSTQVGEKAVLNVLMRNKSAVKTALA